MELPPRDFKSLVSTNFTTRALQFVVPREGVEPSRHEDTGT